MFGTSSRTRASIAGSKATPFGSLPWRSAPTVAVPSQALGDNTLRVWELKDGKELVTLTIDWHLGLFLCDKVPAILLI